jgi:hypothetical protein
MKNYKRYEIEINNIGRLPLYDTGIKIHIDTDTVKKYIVVATATKHGGKVELAEVVEKPLCAEYKILTKDDVNRMPDSIKKQLKKRLLECLDTMTNLYVDILYIIQ